MEWNGMQWKGINPSTMGYQEAHPEKTKVAAGLVSTHRVDERERLRTLEYVHLFNIL